MNFLSGWVSVFIKWWCSLAELQEEDAERKQRRQNDEAYSRNCNVGTQAHMLTMRDENRNTKDGSDKNSCGSSTCREDTKNNGER